MKPSKAHLMNNKNIFVINLLTQWGPRYFLFITEVEQFQVESQNFSKTIPVCY